MTAFLYKIKILYKYTLINDYNESLLMGCKTMYVYLYLMNNVAT